MKIEMAIVILELSKNMDFEGCSDDLEAAHQLGIEALKRLQDNRRSPWSKDGHPLLGETEE